MLFISTNLCQTYNDSDDVSLLYIQVYTTQNKVFSPGFDERREPGINVTKFKNLLTWLLLSLRVPGIHVIVHCDNLCV